MDTLRHLEVPTRQVEVVRNQKKKDCGKGEVTEKLLSNEICKIMLKEEKGKLGCYVYLPTEQSGDDIQSVPGGKDLTSGECSLGQTIPI